MSKSDLLFIMGVLAKFHGDTSSVLNKRTTLRILEQLNAERVKHG
jgi:hypothetical protein